MLPFGGKTIPIKKSLLFQVSTNVGGRKGGQGTENKEKTNENSKYCFQERYSTFMSILPSQWYQLKGPYVTFGNFAMSQN